MCFAQSFRLELTNVSRQTFADLSRLQNGAPESQPTYLMNRLTHSFCLLTGLLPLALGAQIAPTAPNISEETIELSPFEVRSSPEGDYSSTEAVAGTRMADKLKDTPFAVNTLTEEFLADFKLETFDEQLAYVSSFAPAAGEGPYYLRGFQANFSMRNGFKRAGLVDDVTVQQVEVIKGPVVSMYGQGKPGGIVNYVTKSARGRPFTRVGFSTYSQGGYAVTVEQNAIVTDKLRYRIAARYKENEGPSQWEQSKESPIYATFSYQLSPRSTLTGNVEYVESRVVPGAAVIQYYDAVTKQRTGFAYEFYQQNFRSPDAFNHRKRATSDFSLNTQINSWLSSRLAIGGYYNDPKGVSITGGTTYNPASTTRQLGAADTRTPTKTNPVTRYGALQGDLLAAYEVGSVKMKSLLTVDLYELQVDRNEWRSTTATAWANGTIATTRYDLPGYDDAFWNRVLTDATENRSSQSIMASQRAMLMNNRLTLLGGLRGERYEQKNNNLLTNAITTYETDALTYFSGVLYALTPNLTVYANYSSATDIQPGTRGKYGEPVPLEESYGPEIGLKGVMLDDRLTFTLGLYDLKLTNVARSVEEIDPDLGLITYQAPVGEQMSRGAELDLQFKVSKALTLMVSGSVTDAEYTKIPDDADLQGRRPFRVPKGNFSVAGRYRFQDGPLKGVGLNAGYRWVGEARFADSAGARDLMQPEFELFDVGASYRFRSKLGDRRLEHSIQLNVKNLFEEIYMRNGTWGPGRQTIIGYQLRY
jgi:iron complex outermembrane receptor protein